MEAIEKERTRIGKNLHDDVGALLAAIKMEQSGLYRGLQLDSEKEKKLYELNKSLKTAMQVVREASHELTANALVSKGLLIAVEERCYQINQDSKWIVSLTNTDVPNCLSAFAEMSIYRIISELMHNSIKHSGGSEIELDIRQQSNLLYINYYDNGRGMPKLERQGLGMKNIEARIKLLDGSINYTNTKPGLKVVLTFDINKLCQVHQS